MEDRVSGALTLSALMRGLKRALEGVFATRVWVTAEIGSINPHRSGHCYLELVELNADTRREEARMRATMWASRFGALRGKFEQGAGQTLRAGLQVLVRGQVELHPVYGLSLNIEDIDAQYTVGVLAQNRALALRRLQAEGLLARNALLPLPTLPRRVALVSSANAAGYGDFCKHIQEATLRYGLQVRLYEAMLQGASACASLVGALGAIAGLRAEYDAVVIIRGGGASLDLSVFDEYELARRVATMPLPVLTGIGHERDVSLVDLAAHQHFKTPTAVAAFLADRFVGQERLQQELRSRVARSLAAWLAGESATFALARERAARHVGQSLVVLQLALPSVGRVPYAARLVRERHMASLREVAGQASVALRGVLEAHGLSLRLSEHALPLYDPMATLRRGYLLAEREGQQVGRGAHLRCGERITLRFHDGSLEAEVLGGGEDG